MKCPNVKVHPLRRSACRNSTSSHFATLNWLRFNFVNAKCADIEGMWILANGCHNIYIYIPHNAKKSIHFKHIILFINIWRGFCGSCFPTQSSPVIVYSTVTVHHTAACLISALLLQQLVFHTSIEKKSFLLPYKGNTPSNKKLTCPSYGLKTRSLGLSQPCVLIFIQPMGFVSTFILLGAAEYKFLILKFCLAGLLGFGAVMKNTFARLLCDSYQILWK